MDLQWHLHPCSQCLLPRARIVVRTSKMKIPRIVSSTDHVPRRHLSDYVNNCTRKRAARAARLFFLIQLMKSLISGLGVAVVIPKFFAI